MARWLGSLGVVASLALVALAGAPDEAKVQGIYEGTWQGDNDAKGKAEAMVFADGKGQFRMALTRHLPEAKTEAATLPGTTEGEEVKFQGKAGDTEYAATCAGDGIAGKFGAKGTFTLQHAERSSPTFGAKPPEGAIVLFDGTNLDPWVGPKNQPPQWKLLGDGAAEVKGGSITTKEPFTSCKLHVEFRLPFLPEARGQGRANSGVYLPNGDEIQVLDSFGNETYPGGGCGGLYKYKNPDVFALLPPLAWQTYDIEFHAPRQEDGKLVKGRVTVLQNGLKIHDNAELQQPRPQGPILLQDHGNPLQYRNIWIVPLKD